MLPRGVECLRNALMEISAVDGGSGEPQLRQAARHLQAALMILRGVNSAPPGPTVPASRGTVLVLDVNSCNLAFQARALRAAGYSVLDVSHIRETERALKHDAPIAMVVQVPTLSTLDQRRLAALLERRPRPVTILIGDQELAAANGTRFLPTTYTPGELLGALEEVGHSSEPERSRSWDALTDPVPGIISGATPLPGLAPVTRELHALLGEPDAGAARIEALVAQDPAVAGALLRLANSGRYGGARSLETVRKACVRLGNHLVLALANEVLLEGAFRFRQPAVAAIAGDMWMCVRATAELSARLAALVEHPDPAQVRTAGLFHAVGDLLLLRRAAVFAPRWLADGLSLPDELARQSHREGRTLGGRLLQAWGLPRVYQEAAGVPSAAGLSPDDARATEIVRVSREHVIRAGRSYLPGQRASLEAPPAEELGIATRVISGEALVAVKLVGG